MYWGRDNVGDARCRVQYEILPYVSYSNAVRMPVLYLMEAGL